MNLYHACRNNINAPRVIELLNAGADINGPVNRYYDTALIVATIDGAMDIITLLVERGADVNAGGSVNRRSLQFAIRYHRYDIVTYLLDHHADIMLTDDNNFTALHYASICITASEKIIPQLLAAGAVVDAKDIHGRTPLYNTLIYNRHNWRTISMMLLAAKADINTQLLDGNTILHHFHTKSDIDKVHFLLEYGASAEIRNEKGQTAVDTVRDEAIKTLLLEHIASQNVKNAGRRK